MKEYAKNATILAAISSFKSIGRGDKNFSDELATSAMRNYFNEVENARFTIKIGEGEMDEAPMLYRGEVLGKGKVEFDIAVDPLDCTTACSVGGFGAVSAILIAPRGNIIEAPDVYMNKIASCSVPIGVLSLEEELKNNLKNIAKFKKKGIKDVGIITLDRERHYNIIETAQELGVKIFTVKDGDIMAILSTYYNENIDLFFGTGGSPEGVIASSFCKNLGGFFEGKFLTNEVDKKDKIFKAIDLVGENSVFSVTGITNGDCIRGVEFLKDINKYKVNTISICSKMKGFENSTTIL